MTTERLFQPEAKSVPAVRAFVLAAVSGSAPEQLVHNLVLIVSELATNAVVHAKTEFTVGVELNRSTLRIEVTDRGIGAPELQPSQSADSVHGRGLQIVSHLAERWGTTPSETPPGNRIWVEVSLNEHHAQPSTAATCVVAP